MRIFLFQFFLISLVFTGCKMVYTTADVQKNLKQTSDQFASNTLKTRKEFQRFTAEYTSFHCETSKAPYTEAEQKMKKLNASIQELEAINTAVQKDYQDFLTYTKGKKQITSGTDEWDRLKATKKKYETSITQYEEKGKLLTQEATAFQTFVTTQISPKLKKCDVPSYTKKANDEVVAADKNAKLAIENIRKLEGQVTTFILQNQQTQAELCGVIQREWKGIKDQEPLIMPLIQRLSEEIQRFTSATKGMTVIVSCTSDWKVVEDFEQNCKSIQSEVNKINSTINQKIGGMNAMLNPIKK
jgi:hypothetical protein